MEFLYTSIVILFAIMIGTSVGEIIYLNKKRKEDKNHAGDC